MMPPFVTGVWTDRRVTFDQDRTGVLMSILGDRLRHEARSQGGPDLLWISNCACNFFGFQTEGILVPCQYR